MKNKMSAIDLQIYLYHDFLYAFSRLSDTLHITHSIFI